MRYHLHSGFVRATLAAAVAGLFFSVSAQGANIVDTRGYSTLDLTFFSGYQWFQFGQGTNAAVHQFNGAGVWGVRLSQEFSSYIAVEAGIQNSYNGLTLLPVGAPNLSSVPDSQTEIYAAAVLNFAPREAKFRPFIMSGPAYLWYAEPAVPAPLSPGSGQAGECPGGLCGTPGDNTGAGVSLTGRTAFMYGIGLKINASPKWAVRFDLQGMRSGTPHFGLPTIPGPPGSLYIPGGDSHESSLTASVGLTFRFFYHASPPLPAPPAVPLAPLARANKQGSRSIFRNGRLAGEVQQK